ncbi:hypothetical protein GCM10008018_14220 [Paenibacillus marchantiophytorum]|uniref:Beta-N-acetylhexosaminidase n=1 Tax=Paenibacillus marchantiophytorum TaxID=1619310 RepID=A0ABQ2BU97_9BACL|nr:family 20 glycosylhydrolase [Paenibacillus marchantiophytorum]GGI45857.1 hypothetical protein GCM10008018_14220 [Paenibacillus marchantiophytorum]
MRYSFIKRKSVMALMAISLIASLFQLPSVTYAANAAPNVVPSLREWTGGAGAFQLKDTSRIVIDSSYSAELAETAADFKEDVSLVAGKAITVVQANAANAGDIFLTLNSDDTSIGNEGYVLEAAEALSIKGHSTAGVFYGTRTVLQILQQDPSHSFVPKGTAKDYPQFAQRGVMLDVGRRFYSMDYLEDTIKRLAWNKLNTFQIHFSEWNGFRLQSDTYPGLTSTKSYSKADIVQLNEIADRYHVMIIPELEMPGHSAILNKYNSAMKFSCSSMDKDTTGWDIPQFTVDYTKTETRDFIKGLLDEFVPLFKGPYFHIGSDEIQGESNMNACPELVAYKNSKGLPKVGDSFIEFINEMSQHVKQLGKTPMNWNGFEDYHPSIALNKDNVITVWSDEDSSSKQPIAFANEGYKVYAAPGDVLYVTPGKSLVPDTTYLYESWNPAVHANIIGYFMPIWSDYWDQVKTPDGRIGYESGSSFKGNEVGDGEYVIPESNFENAARKPRQAMSERLWGGPRSASASDFFNRVSLIGDEPSVSNPAPADPLGLTVIKNSEQGTDFNRVHYSTIGTSGSNGWVVSGDSYTNLTNAYFDIKFVGTQVKLVGGKAPGHGIAAVSLDGGAEVDADLYASSRQNTTAWYTSPVLPYGEHTIKARVTGRKNSSASGSFLSLERVEVLNRTVVENTVTGTDNHQFNYTGTWNVGAESTSAATNDAYEMKFTGKQIILIGTKAPGAGIAGITIDGGAEKMIDMYASTSQSGANLFVSPILSSGAHTIKVRVTGTKNSQATGTAISVDRAEIVLAEQVNVTGVQVDKDALQLRVGATSEIEAVVSPINATNKNVTWTSSDESVATVADSGNGKAVVTALKAGSATIKAATAEGNFTSVSQVTVDNNAPAAPGTSLSAAASTVQAGGQLTVRLGVSNVTYNVYGQDFKLNYDPSLLEFVSATSVKDGVSIVQTKDQAGTLRLILASEGAAHPVTGTADMAQIVFKAKNVQQAATGSITVAAAILADAQGIETSATASSISVQVTPVPVGVPGDLNHDNKVSIGDLGFAAANYGKTSSSPDWDQVKSADLNNDKIIDILDLAAIAKKFVQ